MRIFFITARFPWPLTKGDQLRAFNQIKFLSKHHEIVLFALSDEPVSEDSITELKPYCLDIKIFRLYRTSILLSLAATAFSGRPFQNLYYFNHAAVADLKILYKKYKPDRMVFQLVRMSPYAHYFPDEKCIIDLMDCLSYHYLLRSKHPGTKGSWFYDMEYRRLKKCEQKALERYKTVVVISNKDKSLLPGNTKHVHVIGNGVTIRPKQTVHQSLDLLFLGNLSYIPNIIAARFLILEVLPILHRKYPSLKLGVAGKNPVRELVRYGSDRVVIIPNPADTLPVFSSSKIFIAPMFLSTGVQNKILEAMATGLPVIASPNAADAIGAVNGVQVLTAVSAIEFAEQISKLIEDEALQNSLTTKAKDHVLKYFSWQRTINLFQEIL